MKTDAYLRQRAQELRKRQTATKQEKHLWYDFLRGLTPQFHRQVVIGKYIVDFYCPAAKLVIELDGTQPDAMEHDQRRTAFLEQQGCRVIRYTNADIDCRFQNVCQHIFYLIYETQ